MLRGFLGVAMLSLLIQPTGFFPKQRSSLQSQELNFTHLKIEELQRQIDGNVKEEEAIPAQTRAFTDLNSWRAFWSQYGKGKVPEVDFKTNYVAVVFLGAKPNPGYGVQISNVIYDPTKKLTVIHVAELLPNHGTTYLAVVVYPGDVIVFPSRPGRIVFKRKQKQRTEQP